MPKLESPFLKTLGTKVGHITKKSSMTGCTVLLFDRRAVCSVHVSGAAPGTRETDLLDPTCMVDRIDGLMLAGGSAFGLAAADGVMKYLSEQGRGMPVKSDRIPIVPTAVIYDRGVGKPDAPGAKDGYKACENAVYSVATQGRIGAGCGATVGKFSDKLTPDRGGFSIVCEKLPGGIIVAAFMVVNALGNVIDPASGQIIAGARDKKGNIKTSYAAKIESAPGTSTTIGAIVTNATLTKSQAKRVAMTAHDGLAKSLNPSHTLYDGDAIFVASTGGKKVDLSKLGIIAAELSASAVVKAVGA